MNVLFIRHAEAMEAGNWNGDDMSRPLTARGRKRSAQLFRFLRREGVQPAFVLSSQAVRARETAELYCGRFNTNCEITPRLNPGSAPNRICRMLERRKEACLAVVGHEPELSRTIAVMCGAKTARIKLSKGACAMVSIDERKRGELCWLLPPFPVLGKKDTGKIQ